ncbi:MAG: exonuclease domain-containing protein [Acidimicrobiales bacterium]
MSEQLSVTRYVGFDLETTGISSFRDSPVSYGFAERRTTDTQTDLRLESGYIHPGRLIPPGATAIHGITDAMVANATPIAEAVESLAHTVVDVWGDGGIIVGMNVSYDLTMVDSLCQRLGLVSLRDRGSIGPILDVLILDRHFDKWRKGSRKLVDLCQHYGVDLACAHSAADDALASLLVLDVMRERFRDIDAMETTDLTVVQRAWYREWLQSFSTFREKQGGAPVAPGEFEWPIQTDDELETYRYSKLVS